MTIPEGVVQSWAGLKSVSKGTSKLISMVLILLYRFVNSYIVTPFYTIFMRANSQKKVLGGYWELIDNNDNF